MISIDLPKNFKLGSQRFEPVRLTIDPSDLVNIELPEGLFGELVQLRFSQDAVFGNNVDRTDKDNLAELYVIEPEMVSSSTVPADALSILRTESTRIASID